MLARLALVSTALAGLVTAQTTYTGCHNHTTSGTAVEYCYGPDGVESARGTYAAAPATITSAPASVSASVTSSAAVSAAAASGQTTAVTSCHAHGTAIFCINGGGTEVSVAATSTSPLPAAYTGCHSHGAETFCIDPTGEEVAVHAEGATEGEAGESSEEHGAGCHFHAGVEHCPGQESSCGIRPRDYDVGLRVGTLFVILVTSGIGVFAPILLGRFALGSTGQFVLLIVKQFGTGIIIATAFVHLYTHAQLMFSNHCLGELSYEATTSAIVMAGIFISFLIEYLGLRYVGARALRNGAGSDTAAAGANKGESGSDIDGAKNHNNVTLEYVGHHHHGNNGNNKLAVSVMEAGILFHSILIGLTLVVAGDSFYRTLLVVIVFHQFFEGLALGARIALLPGAIFPVKFLMAVAFMLITPIGMAIGLGVLRTFNGNNPSTVIAFGTLDALSAGILVWVGVVDMWARDWILEGAEMVTSGLVKTLAAGLSLVLGLVLMGLLGKWA